MITRLGPHAIRPSPAALAWSRAANTVKSFGDTAAIRSAPEHALRVYRWPWNEVEQDRILDTGNADEVVGKIVNGLGGYRHPRLYAELLNEVVKEKTLPYIALARAVVPRLHAAGLKVALPSWSTGAWEADTWEAWRAANWAGADLIALHAYWGNEGFTPWHALRYRTYWRADDPPIAITETGRDRVEGGKGGWRWDGISDDAYLAELEAFDAELGEDAYVWGAHAYTAGPSPDWEQFDVDGLVPRLLERTQRWEPAASDAPPAPAPKPTPEAPVAKAGDLIDLIGKLPTLGEGWPQRTYHDRPLTGVTGCTIHYTAGPASQTVKQIAEYQISQAAVPQTGANQPFPGVAYHVVVTADGVANVCNPLTKRVWHSAAVVNGVARNASHGAICFTGDGRPNANQILGIAAGLDHMEKIAGRQLLVEGHRDAMRTSCPGTDWPGWWPEVERALAKRRPGVPPATPFVVGEGIRRWLEANPDAGQPRQHEWADPYGNGCVHLTASKRYPSGAMLVARKWMDWKIAVASWD